MNSDHEQEGNIATLTPPSPAPASAKPKPNPMPIHESWDDDDDGGGQPVGFFKKHRIPIIFGVIVMTGIITIVSVFTKKGAGGGQTEHVKTFAILPPAPPPPPPPPPPQQEVKQEMIKNEEEKQDDEPAPAVSTTISGAGKGIQLAKGNNGVAPAPKDNSMSQRARWFAYGNQVQGRISDAMRSNPRTRKTSARITARIWVDRTGRITRAVLGGSTGDAAADTALRDEVLNGLQLAQPPPDDMPMPINMRINARRP